MTELKPNPGRVAAALAALAILAAVFFAVSRSPQPSSVQAPAVPAESRLARNLDTPAAEAAAPSEGAPAAEAAAPAGDAPDSALFREAAESAEALAASLPAGSRKIAAALEAAGAAGPFPDDAEFVRGELASWKSDREADEEALRRLGLDEDAVTVRRALMLFRRLSPQGLDPLGLGVVSRWEARPEPVPGPHRPFPLKPPPGEGRAVGAADASPDGSLFLTAGARGLALYEAAGARALWRSGRPAVQAVFWDGSILAAFPDDPLVPAAIVRMSPAGAEEGRAPLPRAPFESWFEIVFAGFSRDRSGAVVILYPSAGSPEAAFLDLRSMTLREGGRLYPVGSADFKDRLSGYAYVPFDYPRLGPGLEDLSGATARLEAAWWRKFGGAAELPEKDPAGGGGRERLLHSGDGRSLLVYGPGRAASFYRIGEDGAPERAGYFSLDDLAAFDPRPMALLGAPPGRPPRALFLFTLGPGDGSYPRPYDKEREVRLCSFAAEGPECAPLPAPPPPLPAPPLPRDVGTQPLAAAAADPATGFSVLAFGNGTVMSLDILRNGLVTLKALMPVRWSAAALCPGGRLALLVDDSGAPWFLDIGQGTFAEPPPGQGGAVLASSACAGDGSALFAGLADGRILRAAPGGKPETLAAAAGIPYSMAADGSGATLWWAEDRSPGGWGPASPWNDDGEEGLLPPLRQDPARSFFWRDTGLYFGYLRRGLRELPPAMRLARLDIGAAAAP
ncbi:MAG: hypothetical protein LBW85_00285, partial [Deltaproteobacteria bacterium]|nr:hypothetical protein [Deltaproteobacteria bacterium]